MASFFVKCMFCGTSRFINGNWAVCDPCGVRGYYNPHYGRWRVYLPAHAVPYLFWVSARESNPIDYSGGEATDRYRDLFSGSYTVSPSGITFGDISP